MITPAACTPACEACPSSAPELRNPGCFSSNSRPAFNASIVSVKQNAARESPEERSIILSRISAVSQTGIFIRFPTVAKIDLGFKRFTFPSLAILSAPYFPFRYSNNSSRRSPGKSMSMSGKSILVISTNRSNNNPYSIGSSSVIPSK